MIPQTFQSSITSMILFIVIVRAEQSKTLTILSIFLALECRNKSRISISRLSDTFCRLFQEGI